MIVGTSAHQRSGSEAHQRFGIASASYGNGAGKFGRQRQGAAQERKDVMAKARGVVFVDCAFDRESFHQTNGAERKSNAAFEHAMFHKIHFKAAAAEVEDQARLDAIAERTLDGGADESCLFFAADDFQLDAGLAANSLHQVAIIPGFASSGGGNGTIGRNVVLVHLRAELAKGADGSVDCFFVEQAARERVVTEANSGAFVIENLDVLRRSGAGDDETDCV